MVSQTAQMTETMKADCQDAYNSETVSTVVQHFGLYLVHHFELLGDAIKQATPNLRKKKDESIDVFKNDFIKPIKENVKLLQTFFADLS